MPVDERPVPGRHASLGHGRHPVSPQIRRRAV